MLLSADLGCAQCSVKVKSIIRKRHMQPLLDIWNLESQHSKRIRILGIGNFYGKQLEQLRHEYATHSKC